MFSFFLPYPTNVLSPMAPKFDMFLLTMFFPPCMAYCPFLLLVRQKEGWRAQGLWLLSSSLPTSRLLSSSFSP